MGGGGGGNAPRWRQRRVVGRCSGSKLQTLSDLRSASADDADSLLLLSACAFGGGGHLLPVRHHWEEKTGTCGRSKRLESPFSESEKQFLIIFNFYFYGFRRKTETQTSDSEPGGGVRASSGAGRPSRRRFRLFFLEMLAKCPSCVKLAASHGVTHGNAPARPKLSLFWPFDFVAARGSRLAFALRTCS